MAVKCTPVVFITANVGSIFEEPAVMLKIWTREFLSTIARLDPKFVALHCQEVGGKNYEKSMQHVEHFVQLLVDSDELRLFDKIRVFLDEDYSSAENFTALGNFYFIHESITDALIYDFEAKTFTDLSGKEIYSKNIEMVPTKEKSKFPLQYFPECKWSRKGFLRTRWSLNGVKFDLVNIHLFHDASNFVAIKSFPSIYSDTRRRALAYTLERFQTDEHGSVPLFVFGDFNFRADTKGVVKHLSEGLKCDSVEGEAATLEFKNDENVVLSLGKKEFSHSDHQSLFSSKEGNWLREYDKELEYFSDQLFEFGISFPPSYPFEENSSGDKCYMKTRCPAWCDRVILSHSAIPLVRDTTGPGNVEYGLMGRNTCMGDHKPVYLKVHIKGSTEDETSPDPNPARTLSKSNAHPAISGLTKNDSDKQPRSPSSNFSEIDVEKLACSLEALISPNREVERNIEPDLSRCSACKAHQHTGRVADNAAGEHMSNGVVYVEDEKIIGLLACEIKVPENVLRKLEVNDTGQKTVKKVEVERVNIEADRFGAVKRVNSASLVENKPKKEDWKNSRCNSDVSWNPCSMLHQQSQEVARLWGINKSFNRGNSRIRLISSSNSLNISLPRLTSHHSSSDEDWFEEIEESDDDVLQVSCEEIADRRKISRAKNDHCELMRDSLMNEAGDKPSVSENTSAEETSSNVASKSGSQEEFEEGSQPEAEEEVGEDVNVKPEENKSETPENEAEESLIQQTEGRSSPIEKDSKLEKKSGAAKTFSILRRLTEGKKDSQNGVVNKVSEAENRASFENLIVEPSLEAAEESELRSEELGDLQDLSETRLRLSDKLLSSINSESFVESQKKGKILDLIPKDSFESWETIELGDKKPKAGDTVKRTFEAERRKHEKANRKKCNNGATCCCTIQ